MSLITEALVSMGGGECSIDIWPKGADCLEAYLPNIVIIQLGIVDCAPKLLGKFDRFLLNLIPSVFKNSYINGVKKLRTRDINNIIVSLSRFKSNWTNYIERARRIKVKVIIIGIPIPDNLMVEKNKNIILNVDKYNQIYSQLSSVYNHVSVIYPLIPTDHINKIYEDGYHPNHMGHKLIYKNLVNIVD